MKKVAGYGALNHFFSLHKYSICTKNSASGVSTCFHRFLPSKDLGGGNESGVA
jgi:hypothetical protein